MEVGAVKQAFNNDLILLKKNLNQAKIQTIHNLTRKAKTLLEKKCPDQLKEKLKRKAESAVNEVLILKKIKAKDVGKFIITHKGELKDYLNKPKVDHDKACARLLLHKAMQEKYKYVRMKFLDVPIKDLFMSRQERRKIKKEARDKQKNKKKDKTKAVNAEGNWNVEEVEVKEIKNNDTKEYDSDKSGSENKENDSSDIENDNDISDVNGNDTSDINDNDTADVNGNDTSDVNDNDTADVNNKSDNDSDSEIENNHNEIINNDMDSNDIEADDEIETDNLGKFVKSPSPRLNTDSVPEINTSLISEDLRINEKVANKSKFDKKKDINKSKFDKKKDVNKNKNFNEKILLRKFKKETEDEPVFNNKTVDPFFITSTGENYMSVAEPRQPDEVKEVHKEGNRKYRRAVMFGHVPKSKPRQNNFHQDNFKQDNKFNRGNNKYRYNDNSENNNKKSSFIHKNQKHDQDDTKSEKLHPSWEAKKRQSGILPFQGKKIVFDES